MNPLILIELFVAYLLGYFACWLEVRKELRTLQALKQVLREQAQRTREEDVD